MEATVSDGTIRFQHRSRVDTFLPEFVRSFSQPMTSVALRRPTLDDVFLDLTGREIRDQELGEMEVMLSRAGGTTDERDRAIAAPQRSPARLAENWRGTWVVAYREMLRFLTERSRLSARSRSRCCSC